MPSNEGASAGHRLGQLVGNWYEEYVARPVIEEVADRLALYCESRWRSGEKVIWPDADGNVVDYDFVFELRAREGRQGIPVAFFETFWRRGSRHSKDKARDDSGKLVYMRDTYPTARMLGIVAAGDFTRPAQELVRSRGIELWYTPKQLIVAAWEQAGLAIDYPDRASEDQKRLIAEAAERRLLANPGLRQEVADNLFREIRPVQTEAFTSRVFAVLSAAPPEYVVYIQETRAVSFSTLGDMSMFLGEGEPSASAGALERSYSYEVSFADGDVFLRDGLSWTDLRELHEQLCVLIAHMERVARQETGHLHDGQTGAMS